MLSQLTQLKSHALSPLISWLLAGPASFAVMQIETSNTTLALVVGACSAFAAAFFTSLPKIISARRESRSSEARDREVANTKLIERMQAFHLLEVANLKSTAADLKQENILVRTTKHNILDAFQNALFTIRELEGVLTSHNIPHEKYQLPTIKSFFDYEDEEMRKISLRTGELQREVTKVAQAATSNLN
jgi:hypothetical protein